MTDKQASVQSFIMSFDLTNKKIVILGGTGVLGSALVRGFADAGAQVLFTGRTAEKCTRVLSELENRTSVEALPVDACDKESLSSFSESLESKWGSLDVLVNAVGGNMPGATVQPEESFFELSPDIVEEVIRLNLMGGGFLPLMVLGPLLTHHKQPASVVLISSMAASRPMTRVVGYAAAKAGIENFTRWSAVELARKYGPQVRVNAIAPGFFLTEQNRFLLTDQQSGALSERGSTIIEHTPLGRFGEPEDLVGAALWLASDASTFVTGTVIPVDGGYSAYGGV